MKSYYLSFFDEPCYLLKQKMYQVRLKIPFSQLLWTQMTQKEETARLSRRTAAKPLWAWNYGPVLSSTGISAAHKD